MLRMILAPRVRVTQAVISVSAPLRQSGNCDFTARPLPGNLSRVGQVKSPSSCQPGFTSSRAKKVLLGVNTFLTQEEI